MNVNCNFASNVVDAKRLKTKKRGIFLIGVQKKGVHRIVGPSIVYKIASVHFLSKLKMFNPSLVKTIHKSSVRITGGVGLNFPSLPIVVPGTITALILLPIPSFKKGMGMEKYPMLMFIPPPVLFY